MACIPEHVFVTGDLGIGSLSMTINGSILSLPDLASNIDSRLMQAL
jgi:hypothetical protein